MEEVQLPRVGNEMDGELRGGRCAEGSELLALGVEGPQGSSGLSHTSPQGSISALCHSSLPLPLLSGSSVSPRGVKSRAELAALGRSCFCNTH